MIPPLEDSSTFDEGIFLSEDMLKTLLISRFLHITFYSVTVDHYKDATLCVTVAAVTMLGQQQEIETYFHNLHLPYRQVQVNLAIKPAPPLYVGEVMLSCTDPNKPYSVLTDATQNRSRAPEICYDERRKSRAYV